MPSGSKFYPVTARTVLLESPTEYVTDLLDGSRRPLLVHKYTDLKKYTESGKMAEAITIVENLRTKAGFMRQRTDSDRVYAGAGGEAALDV